MVVGSVVAGSAASAQEFSAPFHHNETYAGNGSFTHPYKPWDTALVVQSAGTPLVAPWSMGVGAPVPSEWPARFNAAHMTGSRITVAKSHPNALAGLNLAFAALPSPMDMSPFGFLSCTIYVEPIASYLRVTGTTGIDRGYAAVDLPHPPTSSAMGIDLVCQWLVYDPATLDYAATQVHALRLQ